MSQVLFENPLGYRVLANTTLRHMKSSRHEDIPSTFFFFKDLIYFGPQCGSLAAKVLALNAPESHMGAGSNPGGSTSHPAPCLCPGKAVEDGPKPWDPAPVWETRKKLLVFDFISAQLWLWRPLGE